MDNPTTISTNEGEKQLYIGLRDDFFEWRGKIRKYLSKKGLDKLQYYEEIFRLHFVMEAYMKQLAAKMVRNSNAIVKDISNRIAKNPNKSPDLMQRFNDLDNNLARLEHHASVGMRTSDALRHFARNTRGPIIAMRNNMAARVSEYQKKVTEAKKQQLAKSKERTAKQQLELKDLRTAEDVKRLRTTKISPEEEKRRRFEQWKRMEALRKAGALGEREKARR